MIELLTLLNIYNIKKSFKMSINNVNNNIVMKNILNKIIISRDFT